MAKQDIIHPTLDDWRRLYKEAIEFKELNPWEWTSDGELFSVKDPSSGEMGYCCVVGQLGICFGLIVYIGAKGFSHYIAMQNNLIDEKDTDAHLSRIRCLTLNFENRQRLINKDLAIIKELGLVFKGKNAWPQFRSYYPGYHPWYLTDDEAKFMLACVEQAKDVVLRLKEDPDMLVPRNLNFVFTRIPEKKGDKISWTDAWIEPLPYKEVVTVKKDMDMERLERISKTARRTNMTWENDFFYAPATIAEKGERPYYPILILWTDKDSYFIFNSQLSPPDGYQGEILEQFLLAIEKHKIIPAKVEVRRPELHSYIKPLAEYFEIETSIKKKLKSIDAARKSLTGFFTKRGQL